MIFWLLLVISLVLATWPFWLCGLPRVKKKKGLKFSTIEKSSLALVSLFLLFSMAYLLAGPNGIGVAVYGRRGLMELQHYGSFLSGVFAPIAFVALSYSVFIQRKELNAHTKQFEDANDLSKAELKWTKKSHEADQLNSQLIINQKMSDILSSSAELSLKLSANAVELYKRTIEFELKGPQAYGFASSQISAIASASPFYKPAFLKLLKVRIAFVRNELEEISDSSGFTAEQDRAAALLYISALKYLSVYINITAAIAQNIEDAGLVSHTGFLRKWYINHSLFHHAGLVEELLYIFKAVPMRYPESENAYIEPDRGFDSFFRHYNSFSTGTSASDVSAETWGVVKLLHILESPESGDDSFVKELMKIFEEEWPALSFHRELSKAV